VFVGIEFALGEFAAFEFARESRRIVVAAGFDAAGTGDLDPVGGAFASGVAQAQGSASVEVIAGALAGAQFDAPGQSRVDGVATSILQTVASASGSDQVQADLGEARLAVLNAAGHAEVDIAVATDPGFDIQSRDAALFVSAATASVDVAVQAQAHADFSGQATASATLDGRGQGGMVAHGAMVTNIGASAWWGVSEAKFGGRAIASADVMAAGTAAVYMPGLAIALSEGRAQGLSTVDVVSAYIRRVYSTFSTPAGATVQIDSAYRAYRAARILADGHGLVDARAQSVNDLAFAAAGVSAVAWFRGRQVLPYMDPAFDVVERPAEVRSVERPEENRTVEWR